MKLRLRLALSSAGLAVLLSVAVLAGHQRFSRRAGDELLVAMVRREAETHACPVTGGRRETLVIPKLRGGPSLLGDSTVEVEVELFATLEPIHAREPALGRALREGAIMVARNAADGSRELVLSLSDASGGCSAAWVSAPGLARIILPLPLVIGPVVVAMLSVMLGLAPVVRRTRALSLAVRRWREQPDRAEIPPVDPGDDEIGELSQAYHEAAHTLRAQHAELAARERDLREFVENVSHDLATPLSVMQGHLASLAQASDPELLRLAIIEAEYLGALLSSLALSAKLDTDARCDTHFDLGMVATRVAERHRVIARELGVSIEHCEPEEPVSVFGDMTFAEQAVGNLLGNAIRYNHRGGHVAMLLEADAERFVLQIIDDGPGLGPEELVRLRKRGERGERSRSREQPGLGLGLAIVSRVASVHGWEFELAPRAEGGLIASLRGRVEMARANSGTSLAMTAMTARMTRMARSARNPSSGT